MVFNFFLQQLVLPFFLSVNFERETITAPPLFSAPGLNDRLLYMKTGPNNDLTSHFIIQQVTTTCLHKKASSQLPSCSAVLLLWAYFQLTDSLAIFFSCCSYSQREGKNENSSLSRSAGKQHSLEVSYRKLFFCSAPLFVSRFSL